jgi:subtilisin-like proprotein convertase family protein/subtilisin family serine protease
MKLPVPFCIGVAVLDILAPTNSTRADPASVSFRFPQPAAYRLEASGAAGKSATAKVEWLRAWPANGSTNFVEFGSRVVLQLRSANSQSRLLAGSPLIPSRVVATNVFILQAPDAPTAAREAGRLAARPEVLASYPVVRQAAALHGLYAPPPVDPYFIYQWYLEQRNANGAIAGPDMNVRAAWPYTRGQGVVVAVADEGIELLHPDLAPRIAGALNYNFRDSTTDGQPFGRTASWAHGTEVAGLIAADGSNGRGMIGVAPDAQLASWVVFNTNLTIVSDEQLMDMYQFASNSVSVQNHSWGHILQTQDAPTLLEQIGISNAVTFGRDGRGVVMVRSGGNSRTRGDNADDDGYLSDSHVIAVGAVRLDGRVASYSEPGACLLVAAPSGDTGLPTLFTTDLLGTDGVDQIHFLPPNQDLSDYAFDAFGFSGTSASTPLVSGVVALMLSANPDLTYRDAQQILILASRHFDLVDPDLTTNGAGFRVSHNAGFGVPDAGQAVSLARGWSNRPPAASIVLTSTDVAAIPDDGLRLLITGEGVPLDLASIRTLPGVGPHADTPTAMVPLVDVGLATNTITANLTNKAALIVRGTNTFADKINFAAKAGAAFAVVYNFATNTSGSGAPGGDQLVPLGGTDFTPIPAVFIGNSDGEALKSLFATNGGASAQVHLETTNYVFNVTDTLSCEHVAVRVQTDHPLRGDLRITLVSPQGTRSVLQSYNSDINAGPADWTYYSTHHFFESSFGTWTLALSDESPDATGSVQLASLIIEGVAISDADHDGLDDNWEMARLGTLDQGAQDDPDGDGYNNAHEQIMGTDPQVANAPFRLDFSPWSKKLARLSWQGSTKLNYEVLSGTNVTALTVQTNLPGRFPETEWFAPYTNQTQQFFRVRAVSAP